jgi:hypothetical protein
MSKKNLQIKIKVKKPRNPLVVLVVKRKAGKHKNKKREAKHHGYDE